MLQIIEIVHLMDKRGIASYLSCFHHSLKIKLIISWGLHKFVTWCNWFCQGICFMIRVLQIIRLPNIKVKITLFIAKFMYGSIQDWPNLQCIHRLQQLYCAVHFATTSFGSLYLKRFSKKVSWLWWDYSSCSNDLCAVTIGFSSIVMHLDLFYDIP